MDSGNMMQLTANSYNIVGAGVFGASTALRLKRKYPLAQVRLFDKAAYPSKYAASWDWNKVIRTSYTDAFSMKLALEALKAWKSDPLLKPFYHESGTFWIGDAEFVAAVAGNYDSVKAADNTDYSLLSVEEAKREFDGMFGDADYDEDAVVLVSRNSGWAEAKEALEKTVQTAVGEGVEYVEADIAKLEIDDHGLCYGVRSADGRLYEAAHTILCTGAGTAKLLADSDPWWPELQVGQRLAAAAICTGLSRLNDEDAKFFADSAVCCQDYLPGRGGSLPPTLNNELKFWVDISFQNLQVQENGKVISVPDYVTEATEQMKREVHGVKESIFGKKARHLMMDDYRICWDAITPDENFIISPHTACERLYVATGGSFHGFKFLPIIGKYVVKMLENDLEPELAKAWSWDRDFGDCDPKRGMWPGREMNELVVSNGTTC